MLIILHHLVLITKKVIFLVLGKGSNYEINGSFGTAEKKLVLNLATQRQSFVSVCKIMVLIVIYIQVKQKFINLSRMIAFF